MPLLCAGQADGARPRRRALGGDTPSEQNIFSQTRGVPQRRWCRHVARCVGPLGGQHFPALHAPSKSPHWVELLRVL